MKKKQIVCAALCLGVLLFAGGASASDAEGRIAALEARVAALEEIVAGLTNETEAEAPVDASAPFAVGAPLTVREGVRLTVNSYETGARFRYYPAGGYASTTLSARSGYVLLALYVTVENDTDLAVPASALVDADLLYGSDYASKARDTLFYLTSRGVYAGGLTMVSPRSSVDGCLVFALPSEAETSQQRIAVQIHYDGQTFECPLRTGARLVVNEEETIDN